MDMMETAFNEVQALVSDYKANEGFYTSNKYQEQQARKDFIDKFIIALGWDVNHDTQKNPFEQEVKVERGVNVRGAKKRADYAFYVKPNFHDVRFFLEAKRPSAELVTADNYFQAIRYGWNAQTPVVALTNFAQCHILDCRYKPDINSATQRAVKTFHYSEYSNKDKFAEIYWLLSREAATNGSLEKFAAELPKRKGKAVQQGLFPGAWKSIDEAFLEELDEYRIILAHMFKDADSSLDGESLTEIVQRTLDRLVFMRFLEDRHIEPDPLVALFGDKGSAWTDFVSTSQRLDGIYNGIVFKKHAIIDNPGLKVEDTHFSEIREKLSHLNTPYDFNIIPIHILGSIYERFLGKVITAGDKRVRVEEKPEVRKAGGVYYTPEYIVRYIVANTVGKAIEGKSPDQISVMRFTDISCGSGSFLLGMYDVLLKYHQLWYNNHRTKAKKGDCVERDGTLHLTLKKRREILLNNIYGVDIDAQAVEVAQLSLYLKLLDEETLGTAHEYQLEFHETLLPSLNKNVQCGNSLIGTDIMTGELFKSDEEERKLNPMDFEARFPDITRKGGFDAIIGNPPYGGTLSDTESAYFNSRYKLQNYQLDTYLLFLERTINLMKQEGYLGLIIPNTWLLNLQTSKIRKYIFKETTVENIVHYKHRVFDKVTVDTEVAIFRKNRPNSAHKIKICIVEKDKKITEYAIPQALWDKADGKPVNINSSPDVEAISSKLQKLPILDDLCNITQGAKPFQVGKGKPRQTRQIVNDKPFVSNIKKDKNFKPLLRGSLIQKYVILWNNDYWISFGDWLAEPRYSAQYDAPNKIVIRQTGDSLIAALDQKQFIVRDNLYTIVPKEKIDIRYVLALLNSRLLNWYYQNVLNPEKGEALAQVKRGHIAQLPIARISNTADKPKHDEIVKIVDQILGMKRQNIEIKTDKDKAYYDNKYKSLNRQIDELIYKLYDLTEEEIGIVEENSK